jgi:hypothetical protein
MNSGRRSFVSDCHFGYADDRAGLIRDGALNATRADRGLREGQRGDQQSRRYKYKKLARKPAGGF